MVPPAAATRASALLGMDPPLNATRYDWLAVRALVVVSVTGSVAPSPQPTNESARNATTNNDADRIGLSMRGLLGVLEARAYTRLADGPINNLDKVCVTDCQIRDAAPRGFEPMVTPSTIGATSGPLLRDASLAAA